MTRYFLFSTIVVLVAGFLPPDAGADDWVNELLVHRTPTYTADGDESCRRCHSGEKIRAAGKSVHGDEGNPLAPAGSHACESCHGPGSIHVSRAHGGRGFPPLTEFGRGKGKAPREEQLRACMACHANSSYGLKEIGFTGTVHDRKAINCSTCHEAHAEVDPMSIRQEQSATCFRCHRKVKKEHPRIRDREVNFDRISCSACHKLHKPGEVQK